MNHHLFVTCEYPEVNSESYLKIIISKDKEEIKIFENSDPLIVWYEYYKWFYNENELMIVKSSSMDHWFFDTENFEEVFFDPETLEFIEWRESKMYDVDRKYPKCIIRTGMKNFGELKEYIQNKLK